MFLPDSLVLFLGVSIMENGNSKKARFVMAAIDSRSGLIMTPDELKAELIKRRG